MEPDNRRELRGVVKVSAKGFPNCVAHLFQGLGFGEYRFSECSRRVPSLRILFYEEYYLVHNSLLYPEAPGVSQWYTLTWEHRWHSWKDASPASKTF